MKFIKIEDIKDKCPTYLLDQLTDKDYSTLDSYELFAIELVKNFTDDIYNIDYELSNKDELRSYLMVDYLSTIMVYKLQDRKGSRDDSSTEAYNLTIEFLKMIKAKKMNTQWIRRDINIDKKTANSFVYSDRSVTKDW